MDKENAQEKELENAAGGCIPDYSVYCRSCGKQFAVNEVDDTIIYVSQGCSSSKSYYKCPYCGFRWET